MNFKRIIALALAVVLALSVVGCQSGGKDKSWAAKLGDETISAGVYVLNVMAGLNNAQMKADPAVEDFLAAEIEGKTGSQLTKEFALEETKRQLATHSKFVELGLTLTEEEKQSYESYGKDMYAAAADMYKANGVSEQSVIDYNRYSFEAYKVFQAIYGPGGEKGATPADMSTYFAENYNIAYIVPYLKIDEMTGAPLEGEALAKMVAESDAAYKAVQEGKNIADVIYEVGTAQMGEGAQAPERGEDTNYLMVVEKENAGTFPPVVYEHLATAANDSIALVEDDTFRLIIKKVDETKAPEKLSEYYYLQMLPQMKQTEFMDLTLEWANAATVEINQGAIDHFTGEKVQKETDAYWAAQASSSDAAAAPSSLPADASTPGNEPAPSEGASSESASSESVASESASSESSSAAASSSTAG
ncbi:MAG: hypothetical protein RR461_08225 [Angelakisella sp.]